MEYIGNDRYKITLDGKEVEISKEEIVDNFEELLSYEKNTKNNVSENSDTFSSIIDYNSLYENEKD
jgi:hypothetical protein